jgi:hypothetical protein
MINLHIQVSMVRILDLSLVIEKCKFYGVFGFKERKREEKK